MAYEFGDIVLLPFPFTNQAVSKKRPAVVVSNADYNEAKPDIVVMAITSQLRPAPALGEVWIEDWQAANLLQPSAIKPVRDTRTGVGHSAVGRAGYNRSGGFKARYRTHSWIDQPAASLSSAQNACAANTRLSIVSMKLVMGFLVAGFVVLQIGPVIFRSSL